MLVRKMQAKTKKDEQIIGESTRMSLVQVITTQF